MEQKTILFVDDDDFWHEAVIRLLKDDPALANFQIITAVGAESAVQKITAAGQKNISLIIVDGLLGEETAIDVYDECQKAGYQGKFILFSTDPSAVNRVAAKNNRSTEKMFIEKIYKGNSKGLAGAVVRALN